MKTLFALLLLVNRPVMTLQEIATLRGIDLRTAQNMVHDKTLGIPVWKDGHNWFAHIEDVANWVDEQRADAERMLRGLSRRGEAAHPPPPPPSPRVPNTSKALPGGAYVNTAEIADMLNLKRRYVTDVVTKRPDFPRPKVSLSAKNRQWLRIDVVAWIESQTAKNR